MRNCITCRKSAMGITMLGICLVVQSDADFRQQVGEISQEGTLLFFFCTAFRFGKNVKGAFSDNSRILGQFVN